VKHFASTTSVQILDPETVLKFMNSSGIEKSLLLQQGKKNWKCHSWRVLAHYF